MPSRVCSIESQLSSCSAHSLLVARRVAHPRQLSRIDQEISSSMYPIACFSLLIRRSDPYRSRRRSACSPSAPRYPHASSISKREPSVSRGQFVCFFPNVLTPPKIRNRFTDESSARTLSAGNIRRSSSASREHAQCSDGPGDFSVTRERVQCP